MVVDESGGPGLVHVEHDRHLDTCLEQVGGHAVAGRVVAELEDQRAIGTHSERSALGFRRSPVSGTPPRVPVAGLGHGHATDDERLEVLAHGHHARGHPREPGATPHADPHRAVGVEHHRRKTGAQRLHRVAAVVVAAGAVRQVEAAVERREKRLGPGARLVVDGGRRAVLRIGVAGDEAEPHTRGVHPHEGRGPATDQRELDRWRTRGALPDQAVRRHEGRRLDRWRHRRSGRGSNSGRTGSRRLSGNCGCHHRRRGGSGARRARYGATAGGKEQDDRGQRERGAGTKHGVILPHPGMCLLYTSGTAVRYSVKRG